MIVSPSRLEGWLKQKRQCRSGLDVILANGCFDILHAGHVRLLEWARSKYSPEYCLMVALNTDSSVRRLKGDNRPVNCLKDRACVMSALFAVDVVTWFGEDTPEKLIRKVRPRLLLKGADNRDVIVPGAEFVRSYGGDLLLGPYLADRSTTNIERLARRGRKKA